MSSDNPTLANTLGTLDTTSGVITPAVAGFSGPKGLIFLTYESSPDDAQPEATVAEADTAISMGSGDVPSSPRTPPASPAPASRAASTARSDRARVRRVSTTKARPASASSTRRLPWLRHVTRQALVWSRFIDATAVLGEVGELMERYPPRMIAPAHGNVISNPAAVWPVIGSSFDRGFRAEAALQAR